ncbi:hypothetical protein CE91St46_12920 [Eubacteriales bacterium]|nr:hypothetical protein CE91St46_12920 [Eubacteriales bacterium]GKH62817.1 hypothetical protein CE91St47_12860 [Eubacteriales bacterium]
MPAVPLSAQVRRAPDRQSGQTGKGEGVAQRANDKKLWMTGTLSLERPTSLGT